MKRSKKGFTLIELLIVVAIIGIIAAIAIPNILMAIQTAKQKGAMGDMKSMTTGFEAYKTENNSIFQGGFSAMLADSDFLTMYLDLGLSTVDPWGNDYTYDSDVSINGVSTFALGSFGRNGTQDNLNLNTTNEIYYIISDMESFDSDIVFQGTKMRIGPQVKR